jgi:hypothetical protein
MSLSESGRTRSRPVTSRVSSRPRWRKRSARRRRPASGARWAARARELVSSIGHYGSPSLAPLAAKAAVLRGANAPKTSAPAARATTALASAVESVCRARVADVCHLRVHHSPHLREEHGIPERLGEEADPCARCGDVRSSSASAALTYASRGSAAPLAQLRSGDRETSANISRKRLKNPGASRSVPSNPWTNRGQVESTGEPRKRVRAVVAGGRRPHYQRYSTRKADAFQDDLPLTGSVNDTRWPSRRSSNRAQSRPVRWKKISFPPPPISMNPKPPSFSRLMTPSAIRAILRDGSASPSRA